MILILEGMRIKDPMIFVSVLSKQELRFLLVKIIQKNYLDLFNCDIWGAYKVSSLCGAQLFFTIIDDASRAVWVYLMREKGKASLLL